MHFRPLPPSTRRVLPAVGFLTAVQMATNPALAEAGEAATSPDTTAPLMASLPGAVCAMPLTAADKPLPHRRLSGIIGAQVRDRHGDKIGNVRDIVLDGQGSLAYAIVGSGEMNPRDERLLAVPWSALAGQNGPAYTIHLDRQTLVSAAGFASQAWPDFSDPQWQASNLAHYRSGTQAA